MIEWLKAQSYKDVARFYEEHYIQDGAQSFCEDRSPILELLKHFSIPDDQDFDPYKRLLDAGCGNGDFLLQVCHRMQCYGVEISRKAFLLAKAKVGHVAELGEMAIEEIPKHWRGTFDYVTCLGVLEHTMEPRKCHEVLMDCLRPAGILLVTVPLQFETSLSYILREKNQNTNERFGSVDDWIDLFGKNEEGFAEIGEGDTKHLAIIYKKEEA